VEGSSRRYICYEGGLAERRERSIVLLGGSPGGEAHITGGRSIRNMISSRIGVSRGRGDFFETGRGTSTPENKEWWEVIGDAQASKREEFRREKEKSHRKEDANRMGQRRHNSFRMKRFRRGGSRMEENACGGRGGESGGGGKKRY